jgi:cytochrome oxidase Cu insertion factor (SCO1/SenC/PrrC family)
MSTATPTKRGLGSLWALLIVFALPVLAAWFLYFNPEYLPAGRSNRGELIEPLVTLPTDRALSTPEGTPFAMDALSGRWTLVFLTQSPCTAACENKLGEVRQIRLALGESRLSVERLLLLTGPSPPSSKLAGDLAGTQVALLSPEATRILLPQLGPDKAPLDRIYILDPLGRLMMRYAPEAPPKDVLKDMERLLKASKNWIKGAQYGHQ